MPGQTRRHRVKKTSALDIGAHAETRALDARMHPGETSWMDHIFLLKFASIGLFLSDQLGLVVYNENIKKNKLNHNAPPSPNRHCKRHLLGPVWYVCLKTENCCLKTFVEIRVGEKVR